MLVFKKKLRCNLWISFSMLLLGSVFKDVLLYAIGSLLGCFDFNFLSIAQRKLAGKPFYSMNLDMKEFCLFRKYVLQLYIRTARQNNHLIQAVLREQGSKLWKYNCALEHRYMGNEIRYGI